MLAVVASRLDSEATALAWRWTDHGAALLTCEDLSTSGWRHFPGDERSSTAVVSGSVIPVLEIQGVLVRRPNIFEAELAQVAAADREYVAAEMNAFLFCWLAALRCPVFNPPTPACLSGPRWGPQQWAHTAAGIGIPVRPIQWCVPASSRPRDHERSRASGEVVSVTVVDNRCFGEPNKAVMAQALRLAAAAGVRFLSVRFDVAADPPVFLGAETFPRLTDHAVTDALLVALLSKASRGTSPTGRRG